MAQRSEKDQKKLDTKVEAAKALLKKGALPGKTIRTKLNLTPAQFHTVMKMAKAKPSNVGRGATWTVKG